MIVPDMNVLTSMRHASELGCNVRHERRMLSEHVYRKNRGVAVFQKVRMNCVGNAFL